MANDLFLWRKLTKTDFNGMIGNAQKAGTGGGAMHISLGVNNKNMPTQAFLQEETKSTVTIKTEAYSPHFPDSQLVFAGNPGRRGGEWRITDQRTNRHPAWTTEQGFPTAYDASNPPIVIIVRKNGKYYPRFVFTQDAPKLPAGMSGPIQSQDKGIAEFKNEWSGAFDIEASTSYKQEYETLVTEKEDEFEDVTAYSPKDQKDARTKVLREVVRRQGQPKFRKDVLAAYENKCPITGSALTYVLQAAHITPYLGPDTNNVTNGMPLRADVHTLWDLKLISINPENYKICVSPGLKGTEYEQYEGQTIVFPKSKSAKPSLEALKEHFQEFQKAQD